MAKADVSTLVSITGQAEDDVIATLKQYGGDLEAATNALLDSECPDEPRNPPRHVVIGERNRAGNHRRKKKIAAKSLAVVGCNQLTWE